MFPTLMKTFLRTFLLAAISVFAATSLRAEDSNKKPYTLGSSYILVLSSAVLPNDVQLPSTPVTITEDSGDWIRIKYSTFRPERSKTNPGETVSVETVHQAWVNLDHVAALIEQAKQN